MDVKHQPTVIVTAAWWRGLEKKRNRRQQQERLEDNGELITVFTVALHRIQDISSS